jgi:hypothetical protein
VIGELLSLLQRIAVHQLVRDAGGLEGVATYGGLDAGFRHPPAHHFVDISAGHPVHRELPGLSPLMQYHRPQIPQASAKSRQDVGRKTCRFCIKYNGPRQS